MARTDRLEVVTRRRYRKTTTRDVQAEPMADLVERGFTADEPD
jgi:hypothetical protein